jgi:DNA-directed RNA polymerase specialized sigma24 family protein
MSFGQPEHVQLSQSEIAEAIRGLPDAGWLRLRKIANAFARNCPLEADDLLHEAFTRAIAGTRQCPRHVDVIRFLAEAMHSIASDGTKARKRQDEAQAKHPAFRLMPTAGNTGDNHPPALPVPSPEDVAASEEEAARIKAAVLSLFADDLTVQTIVEGDMEDMEAEEIRSLTGLDKVSYASKRRLIRRRIERAFPNGWRP